MEGLKLHLLPGKMPDAIAEILRWFCEMSRMGQIMHDAKRDARKGHPVSANGC